VYWSSEQWKERRAKIPALVIQFPSLKTIASEFKTKSDFTKAVSFFSAGERYPPVTRAIVSVDKELTRLVQNLGGIVILSATEIWRRLV